MQQIYYNIEIEYNILIEAYYIYLNIKKRIVKLKMTTQQEKTSQIQLDTYQYIL